jgi:hypothetical protein
MERCGLRAASISACVWLSRRGPRTLYLWVKNWPGRELPLGGFTTPLRRAAFAASGKPVRFVQTRHRIVLEGLPAADPDRRAAGITLLRLDFAGEPRISENSAWFLRADD